MASVREQPGRGDIPHFGDYSQPQNGECVHHALHLRIEIRACGVARSPWLKRVS